MLTHPAAGWYIRPFERMDYHPCYRLFRDCLKDLPWRGPMGPYLRQLFNSLPSAKALVAEEERAGVVGFLTLRRENAYVDHLFVHRDWRFCGVARGLLDVARQEMGSPLCLDVDTQNTGARRAYEALGWKVVARAGGVKADQIRLIGP